jgi:cation-transporting ATPase E
LLVILCALSAATGAIIAFPFITIQITVADEIIGGWPTLWLSFESDRAPVQRHFLKTSLLRALPNALLITASIVFIHFYGRTQGWSHAESNTLMYCVLGALTFLNVIKACLPLNMLRIFLLLSTAALFYAAVAFFGRYMGLGTLTANMFIPLVLIVAVAGILRATVYKTLKV